MKDEEIIIEVKKNMIQCDVMWGNLMWYSLIK